MKQVYILFALALLSFSSCKKENFMDRYVPEVLYYQNNKVEGVDFKTITLGSGVNSWMVKARVSAPSNLKEVKLYKANGNNEVLLNMYSDFQLSPTVFILNFLIEGISTETVVKIVATDMNNKTTERNFTIKKDQ